MELIRVTRPGRARRRPAILGALFSFAVCVQLVLAAGAGAVPYSGPLSLTIINQRADVFSNAKLNGRDDAHDFYGDTDIIDGKLDCDAGVGNQGDGVIDGGDDCTLNVVGGGMVTVTDGEFVVPDGELPQVVGFEWEAIDGKVDSDHDGVIDGGDCHLNLVGIVSDAGVLGDDGTDILGADPPCSSSPGSDGLVDKGGNGTITALDSCADGCFFGRDLVNGLVDEPASECPGFEGDPRNDVVGTADADELVGTAGDDIICGFGGSDDVRGGGGNDLVLAGGGADSVRAGSGADVVKGGGGGDTLRGGGGNDRLLGQLGNDRLLGQRGRDVLLGSAGRDHMNGGRGFDRCRGGRGADSEVSCEAH